MAWRERGSVGLQASEDGLQETDLGNMCPDGCLNAYGECNRGRWAAHARPFETNLENSVCIKADHLDVAAISTQARTDVFIENGFHASQEGGMFWGNGFRHDWPREDSVGANADGPHFPIVRATSRRGDSDQADDQ